VHISFPCYFLLFKDNFLSLRPQPRPLTHVIIPIQAALLVLLAAQKYFGARFCVPTQRYKRDLCLIWNDMGRALGYLS
jgi:hypothetical protein